MSVLYIVQPEKTAINNFRAQSDTNRENQLWKSPLASKEGTQCEKGVDGSLSKIMSLKISHSDFLLRLLTAWY